MIGNRRQFYRQGLSDLYLPLYDLLCGLLGPEWQPYGGYRTPENQDKTFAIGRIQAADGTWTVIDKGKVETDAQGGESPHNYGCATDWTYFSGPNHDHLEWLEKDDPLWAEYVAAVKQAKLRPGAEFHARDMDHNELRIAVSWKEIHKAHLEGGRAASAAAIYAALLGPPAQTS